MGTLFPFFFIQRERRPQPSPQRLDSLAFGDRRSRSFHLRLEHCRLVLWWVTVSVFSSRCRTFISVCDQPSRSTQPGHPFLGRRSEYQPKGGDVLRLGSKVRLVPVWVAGKTVWSHCYIPLRAIIWVLYRDKWLIIKRYIYSIFMCLLFTYFTSHPIFCPFCSLFRYSRGGALKLRWRI